MFKQELVFHLERETKGAARYQELDADGQAINTDRKSGGNMDDAVIGTIYIRKAALNGTIPDTLEVRIRGD